MSFAKGTVGAIYVTDSEYTITDTACTLQDDNKTLNIDSNTYRYLKKSTVIVKKDTVALDPNSYQIKIGGIVFYEEQTAGTYTISATYYDLVQAGGFFNYSINASCEILDTTEFGNEFVTNVPGNFSWSASAEKYYIDNTFQALFLAATELIVVFYTDTSASDKYEGYGTIDKASINTDAKGIIKETLNITGNGILINV